jgi:type I restriction enzyme R subunit
VKIGRLREDLRRDKSQPIGRAEIGLRILKEKVGVLRDMMSEGGGVDTEPLPLLLDVMASVMKVFSLYATLDEAAAMRTKIAFLAVIRNSLAKHESGEPERNERRTDVSLRHILNNAVVAEESDDIFKLAGLERPNIGLLSEEFLEGMRQMPAKNLAVELLERSIKDEIRAKFRNNAVPPPARAGTASG